MEGTGIEKTGTFFIKYVNVDVYFHRNDRFDTNWQAHIVCFKAAFLIAALRICQWKQSYIFSSVNISRYFNAIRVCNTLKEEGCEIKGCLICSSDEWNLDLEVHV